MVKLSEKKTWKSPQQHSRNNTKHKGTRAVEESRKKRQNTTSSYFYIVIRTLAWTTWPSLSCARPVPPTISSWPSPIFLYYYQNFGVDYLAFSELCPACPPDYLKLAFTCVSIQPATRPKINELVRQGCANSCTKLNPRA